MSESEVFRVALDFSGVSTVEFVRRVGISRSLLTNWWRGAGVSEGMRRELWWVLGWRYDPTEKRLLSSIPDAWRRASPTPGTDLSILFSSVNYSNALFIRLTPTMKTRRNMEMYVLCLGCASGLGMGFQVLSELDQAALDYLTSTFGTAQEIQFNPGNKGINEWLLGIHPPPDDLPATLLGIEPPPATPAIKPSATAKIDWNEWMPRILELAAAGGSPTELRPVVQPAAPKSAPLGQWSWTGKASWKP